MKPSLTLHSDVYPLPEISKFRKIGDGFVIAADQETDINLLNVSGFLLIYNSPLISPAYGLGRKLSTSAATASMALIVKLAYGNLPRNDLKQ